MRSGWRYHVLWGVVLTCAACTPAPEGAPPATPAGADADGPRIAFADVTAEAGLADFRHLTGGVGDLWFPEEMGGGVGWLDYDGDGRPDLALLQGGAFPAHGPAAVDAAGPAVRLYRNRGDGTFAEVTAAAGLAGLRAYATGLAAADADGDGDADVVVTALGRDRLLINEGGRFREAAEGALPAGPGWSSSALFFDADRDGDADLYVGGYADWSPETDVWCTIDGTTKEYCSPNVYTGVPSRFYRNRGDGTFADETAEAGFLPSTGKTLGVVDFDFNRDGWPDLAVANDGEPDQLYRNDGDGTFTEIGVPSGIAFSEDGEARAGMGIDAGVLDGTGEASVVVGNFSHEMVGVYRHLRDGLFLDRAAASRVGHRTLLKLTFGLFLFDADLDGDLDLFVANGHVYPSVEQTKDNVTYRQPPQLFLNRGDGVFDEHTDGAVWQTPLLARGAAWADYDGDGDLDIALAQNGGPARLLRNDTHPAGNALHVRLRGAGPDGGGSHAAGLSSRVVGVLAGGRRVEGRVRTGSSYLAQSAAVAVLGLGSAGGVEALEVHWSGGPSAERVERLGPVGGGRVVVVEEGRGIVEEIPFAKAQQLAAAEAP